MDTRLVIGNRRIYAANIFNMVVAVFSMLTGISYLLAPALMLESSVFLAFGLTVFQAWCGIYILGGALKIFGMVAHLTQVQGSSLLLMGSANFLYAVSVVVIRGFALGAGSIIIIGLLSIGCFILAAIRFRGGISVVIFPKHGEYVGYSRES